MHKIAKRFYADTIDILGGAKIKVKSISLKIELIGLVTIALSIAGGKMGLAGISKGGGGDFCKLCHTCGGDGAGGGHKPLKSEYQGPEGCVNCHSSSEFSTTYELSAEGETVTVPVVNYTGTEAPTTFLAGGNFWWVAQTGGDSKGHNVLGIAGSDPNYAEAPGNVNDCSNSCHYSLATTAYNSPGCHGCHMTPAHHADDSNTVVGGDVGDTDGFYRFLSGHMSGTTHGVCGIEDDDWEAISSAIVHNEYLGWVGDHGYAAGFYNLGHTMTAFCCGCHGNYHIQEGSSQRHPADLVIPNSGEFAHAFDAEGSGTGTYDPNVPVARPSLSDVSGIVTLGTDMAMCLSCHRAHGSPYPKMLRWDLSGCFKCHTKK